MNRTWLPWQNHQTHRRKPLQSDGAQPVNNFYGQWILTSCASSIDPATGMSPVNWTPHGLQSNGMSWSNDRLRELARSRRKKTSPLAYLQCRVPHLFHHSFSSPHWCVRQLQQPWRGYLYEWPCWRAPWVVVRRRMKKPGSHTQHHRATAEHQGHPPSTGGSPSPPAEVQRGTQDHHAGGSGHPVRNHGDGSCSNDSHRSCGRNHGRSRETRRGSRELHTSTLSAVTSFNGEQWASSEEP